MFKRGDLIITTDYRRYDVDHYLTRYIATENQIGDRVRIQSCTDSFQFNSLSNPGYLELYTDIFREE